MIERRRSVSEMNSVLTPSDGLTMSDDLMTADEAAALQRALREALAAIEGIREPLDALSADPDDAETAG